MPLEARTFVYKTVDGCAIHADVFGAEPGARKPVFAWIHGGGLIFGTRAWQRAALFAQLVEAGVVVVTLDHRLAPETKLAEIVGDVADAWRWIAEDGPALFGADPARRAIGGGSAGAYLSLLTAARVTPRPRAVLSFWGFGDITTPWETEPSRHYLDTVRLITREEALEVVGTRAISEPLPGVDRGVFYVYARQQGRWPIEVAGRTPRDDPRWFDAYCPARNIDAHYPPTMLVHGTADTDVPYEESQNLAVQLAAAGVAHEFVTLDGIGHGYAGSAPELVAQTEARAAAFVLGHLA